MRTLYFDNDVTWKLAACDLLDAAVSALDSDPTSVRLLATFKHRFGIANARNRPKIQEQIGLAAYDRILAFQRAVGEVGPVSVDLLAMLEDVPAVDQGEAILFASAIEHPESLVLTGDKRSLRSLASSDGSREIASHLAGRVVCFEQVIKVIIAAAGFEHVKSRVVPAIDCDVCLRSVFGSGLDAEEDQVRFALDGYISELRNATGTLLWE